LLSPFRVEAAWIAVGDYTSCPSVQLGAAETPELADLDRWDLAAAGHSLKSLRVNLEQFRGLVAVEQGLELVLTAGFDLSREGGPLHNYSPIGTRVHLLGDFLVT
jgi:hypothetical protein